MANDTDLAALTGREQGPVSFHVDPARIAAFVAATGDDPDRWLSSAPPGFGAALLFAIAPRFLADETVLPFTRVLIHSEQRFEWHAPIDAGADLSVGGKVEQVKERRGLFWVTFVSRVDDAHGERILDSTSVFLMGRGADATASPAERTEPPLEARGRSDAPAPIAAPPPGTPAPEYHKSASRSDLVTYAVATGDFNPIHQDHGAAVTAGLAGVVVHGLLTVSWMVQAAGRWAAGPVPLRSLAARFRKPLFPGQVAVIGGRVDEDGRFSCEVNSPEGLVATGRTEPAR